MTAVGTAGEAAGGVLGGAIGGAIGAPILPPVGGLIGRWLGSRIGRAAGRAAAEALANQMDDANDAAEEQSTEDATETCAECGDPEDPCAHLRRGGGTGPHRGGSHGEMTKPRNDNLDSHHIPPKSCFPSEMWNDLPAIQMRPEDHRQTQSHAMNGRDGIRYRQEQCDLIREGRMGEAIRRDIEDVRRIAREAGDPGRYDEALAEMEAYEECRRQHEGGASQSPPAQNPSGSTNPSPGNPPTS